MELTKNIFFNTDKLVENSKVAFPWCTTTSTTSYLSVL